VLSKDTEWLKREAKIQIAEAQRERMHGMVEAKEAADSVTIAKDAGFDTTDSEQQLGRPLSSFEVQKRLRSINPALSFDVSVSDPSKTGVYFFDGVSNQGTLYTGRRFICGMESGLNPEFGIRKSDGKKMIGQIKGWRTVLVQLIKCRLITIEDAERVFKTNFGRESANWKQQLTN
jgi:hypothetical protein